MKAPEGEGLIQLNQNGKKSIYYAPRKRMLSNGESRVRLSKQRSKLFSHLIAHPDEILSRTDVFRLLFPSTPLPENEYEAFKVLKLTTGIITQLRNKLKSVDPTLAESVKTIKGVGI